ncbi:MAG: DUF4942 domain-containing protein [Proteobacteria bacterium]|nr:DUF4942 domain-containing protein [Pseudomonadota bacterium]
MNQAAQVKPFRGIPCLQDEAVEGLLNQRGEILDCVSKALGLFEQAEKMAGTLSIRFPFIRRTWDGSSFYELESFIREIDSECWRLLMDWSGLKAFMGISARKLWDDELNKKEVRELTLDSIETVFRERYAYRLDLFEQGVKELFCAISWDRKSDLPQQLGKKYIQSGLFNDYGSVQGWSSARLDELIRIFLVLDDKPESFHEHVIHAVLCDAYQKGEDVKNDYVQVRLYQNGNGHVTFLRPDLVAEMNMLITRQYPNALPPK